MILYLLSSSSFTASISPSSHAHSTNNGSKHRKTLFISSFLPNSSIKTMIHDLRPPANGRSLRSNPRCSLLETPVLWAGRGSASSTLFSRLVLLGPHRIQSSHLLGSDGDDLGFSKWFESFQGAAGEKEANDRRKLVRKWHPTTKGTLKRSYRVPSKSEGRRLLKAIASLLSDDDHFVDATSHKGCQIRRESAHGESVCCNNVRALFDELPTPHLVVEITAFPSGPLTDKDYVKAEKLERVLRSGSSI